MIEQMTWECVLVSSRRLPPLHSMATVVAEPRYRTSVGNLERYFTESLTTPFTQKNHICYFFRCRFHTVLLAVGWLAEALHWISLPL